MLTGLVVVTNIISWAVTFLLAFSIITTFQIFRYGRGRTQTQTDHGLAARRISDTAPQIELASRSGFELVSAGQSQESREQCGKAGTTPILSRRATEEILTSSRSASVKESKKAAIRAQLVVQFPVIVSLVGFFLIGAPVAAATGETRILDGFAVWNTWIMAIKTQRLFKTSALCSDYPRTKNAVKTLMNPVLITTLVLVAYTRAKAAVVGGYDITKILETFSSRTPIYSLWTARVTGDTIPSNPDLQFGAGDAALSILEVGILIWGFKLFECRRQLFSMAGLFTVLISIWAASLNVFLGVILSRWFGLNEPEALAFAARSTTLALAKPAIEAMNGNLAVNAALVVSNGILGQLVYPYVLDRMGVKKDVDVPTVTQASSSDDTQNSQDDQGTPTNQGRETPEETDDAMTIAAGMAIGINGAAMGVAYLYETKSRAAPYAALSMTVFGVMTVVFTTVEPFKSATMAMAG